MSIEDLLDVCGQLSSLVEYLPQVSGEFGQDLLGCCGAGNDQPGAAGRVTRPALATALKELLADLLRVLGADHPNTLTTRDSVAYWRSRP